MHFDITPRDIAEDLIQRDNEYSTKGIDKEYPTEIDETLIRRLLHIQEDTLAYERNLDGTHGMMKEAMQDLIVEAMANGGKLEMTPVFESEITDENKQEILEVIGELIKSIHIQASNSCIYNKSVVQTSEEMIAGLEERIRNQKKAFHSPHFAKELDDLRIQNGLPPECEVNFQRLRLFYEVRRVIELL